MSKEPKEYLRHIQDECLYIISVSENLLFENFLEDGNFETGCSQKFGNNWRSHEENSRRNQRKMEYHYARNERPVDPRLYGCQLCNRLGCNEKQNS